MHFIDWTGLAANLLWILGLALLLTTWSLGYNAAQRVQPSGHSIWQQPAYRGALLGGLSLWSSGLAATSDRWWEQIAWGVLAIVWAAQLWGLRRSHVAGKTNEPSE